MAVVGAGLVAAVVVHELGHALAAILLGGHVAAVGLGSPRRARHVRGPAGTAWFLGPRAATGVTTWLQPPPRGWSPGRWAAVVGAGPAVNVLAGAACLLGPAEWRVLGALQLLHGVSNLLPAGRGPHGAPSDGTQLLALWRGAPAEAAACRSAPPAELAAHARAFRAMGCPALSARLWLLAARAFDDDGRAASAARARARAGALAAPV